MKKNGTLIILFFVFGIFSSQKNNGLIISQSKNEYSVNDSIPKVVYPQKWENNKTLVLLNEQTTSLVTLNTINPEHIKNFKIEKGKFNFEGKEYDAKIIVKTKKEFNSNFITIDELISKYTNLKKEDKFIYSINGEVANATEKNILVDEKYIMQIKVVKLDKIEENLNFIKILTRSKQNLNNANEIIIRGNEISMNE